MRLGAHESIAGGIYKAFERAESVGCDAVQLFVKPNRQWAVPPLTDEDVALFEQRARETGIHPAVGHASYLLNLASPKEELWLRSIDTLIVELERCERLGIPYLVLHPGAHTGSGVEAGLERVAEALAWVHDATPGFRARILLETTAGAGTMLCGSFQHLAWLLEHTPESDRLGVCLDTCHVFAAGHDLRTPRGYAVMMDAFEDIVGLEWLLALHLNDCKSQLGERKDRHAHIGQGSIGLEGFRPLLNDPRLDGLPGLLETPKGKDLREDRENLARLRALIE
jgi:deoxyribonuclease-4